MLLLQLGITLGIFTDLVEFGKEALLKDVCWDSRGSGRRLGSDGGGGGDWFSGFFSGLGGLSFGLGSSSGDGGFLGTEKRDENGFEGGLDFRGVGPSDVNVSKAHDTYMECLPKVRSTILDAAKNRTKTVPALRR